MPSSNEPVHRLVTYRPKPGGFESLKAILLQHGTVLRQTGLLAERPIELWVARDLRRDGSAEPYFVESFHWKDAHASELAHQMPAVMAVWETIGPHVAEMTLTTLTTLEAP
jgi:hypothetical protein